MKIYLINGIYSSKHKVKNKGREGEFPAGIKKKGKKSKCSPKPPHPIWGGGRMNTKASQNLS
jgi:hypothetical protein